MQNFQKSEQFYNRGIDCDNAGDLNGAIENYTKAIKLNNHPMAYYSRACVYKDLGKYKKAIKDSESYLKYDPASSPEATASRVTIEELKQKI